MHKIIISADDYGLSLATNQAIEEGIAAGVITSTNVMTGMEFCEAAKDLKSKYPNLSVGIHWTLTEGSKPVSSPDEIPSLVDDNGRFFMLHQFHSRYRKGLIKDEDILREYRAQYDKFVRICGQPDYWNSHQNSHVDFRIFDLALNLACELGIPKMRSNQRIYVPRSCKDGNRSLVWRLIEPFKSKLMDIWHKRALRRGVKMPDGIILCMNPNDNHRLEYIVNNIKWERHSIGEIVMHPATHVDSDLMGLYTDIRLKEYEIFCQKETFEMLKRNNINLVSYDAIE